eukprot:5247389-Pyramimonas_sp.AAC.2
MGTIEVRVRASFRKNFAQVTRGRRARPPPRALAAVRLTRTATRDRTIDSRCHPRLLLSRRPSPRRYGPPAGATAGGGEGAGALLGCPRAAACC